MKDSISLDSFFFESDKYPLDITYDKMKFAVNVKHQMWFLNNDIKWKSVSLALQVEFFENETKHCTQAHHTR